MEQHEKEHHDNQAVETNTQNAQDREIIAYFSSLNQAHRAAERIRIQVQSVHVVEISEQRLHETLNSAQAGISVADIGIPAWFGVGFGLIAGAILGLLVYSNRIALPGIAPALSAGPVAVSFLLAGTLGSIGWLTGALVHLLRIFARKTMPEVRAIVSDDIRPEVEKMLLNAGALDVLVTSGVEHTQS